MVGFTILGIPVQVQPFFWVTLALIGGALRASSPAAILQVFLFLLAGFVSILIHELGHALMARKFGARSEIVLQAFGGYAEHSGVRLTRPQNFAVTAAGPLVQMLLGLVLWLLIPHAPLLPGQSGYFFTTLMGISVFWALLNLLPVLPLDGGRMLDAVMGPRRIRITLWTSIIVATVIGLVGFLLMHSLLLLVFMGLFAWQSWQALRETR